VSRGDRFVARRKRVMKYSLLKTTTMVLGLCVMLSGCVWLRSSSIGDRGGSGQTVRVSTGDYGILHLTTPDGITEAANSQLVSQCQGKLTNPQTEMALRVWILIQWYSVNATAVCQ
jgi:hypothetical protein